MKRRARIDETLIQPPPPIRVVGHAQQALNAREAERVRAADETIRLLAEHGVRAYRHVQTSIVTVDLSPEDARLFAEFLGERRQRRTVKP